jgi:hypothetical protein
MLEVIMNNIHVIDGINTLSTTQVDRIFMEVNTFSVLWGMCLKCSEIAKASMYKSIALAKFSLLTKANIVNDFVLNPQFDPSALNSQPFTKLTPLSDTPHN